MTAPEFGVRRQSREMALQLLFQSEFRTQPTVAAAPVRKSPIVTAADKTAAKPGPSPRSQALGTQDARDMFRRFVAHFEVAPEVSEYGGRLFVGVNENLAAIDNAIQAQSAHWKVARMGIVELAIMRIAVFEMKFDGEPLNPKIAIDEAIELAKHYGSTESGAFVNGILDQVSRAN